MDPSALNSPELERFLSLLLLKDSNLIGYLIWFDNLGDGEEKERAMVNEMVAKLTSACWDKCITSTPGSKLSSSESSCLSNCARSYMDMSLIIMKRFQSMN
ncbi:hypothetical protein NC652_029940 [Populus alba x Populus x berolinensis]|nr:hypothetical protein NC651_028979 [Populus alba x Populus x berolinensis]KAJ6888997.1 hypothetical protein NC652_029940 [Populus alba x Populus x berolinensis]